MMNEEDRAPRGTRSGDGLPGTAVLLAGFVAVYATSVSNHLTGDSTWYAHDIMWPGDQFWHPHHLLYNPLMRLLLIPFAGALGGPEGRMIFLQWINLVLGAMASAIFYLVARRMGARRLEAAAFTLMMGLSGASWFFSSQIEVYSLTSLFLCVALLGVLDGLGGGRRGPLMTAAGFAGALFFHQTAILMLPPILLYAVARSRDRNDRRAGEAVRSLAVSWLLPLAVVGLTYLVVGFSLGDHDVGSLWRWLTMHVQYGFWGKGDLSGATLLPAWRRCARAVLGGTGKASPWLGLYLGALGLFVAARIAAAGRRVVRDPGLFAALMAWAALLAGFSTWWDASGAEFWGMVLLPFYLALSLLAPAAGGRPGGPGRLSRTAGALAGAALGCCLVLIGLSSADYHRWNLRPDDIRQAARAAPLAARDGDLVLASGTDRSVYYRIYLDARPVSVLALNVKPAREARERSTASSFTAALVDVIESHVRETASRGGRCLADHWIVDGTFTTTRLMSDVVPSEFVQTLRRRFQVLPPGDGAGALFYELRLRD